MKWKAWIKLERLIPAVTILSAIVASVLSLFNVIQLSGGERIVIVLLALLAGDALTERLAILQKMREEIKALKQGPVTASSFFRLRAQLRSLADKLATTTPQTIDACGMSLLGLSTQHSGLLVRKVQEGSQMRLLLLNSENADLTQLTYRLGGVNASTRLVQEIRTSRSALLSDPQFIGSDQVQIRIYDYAIGHAMLIIDGNKPGGELRVAMYITGRVAEDRPVFTIRRDEDREWFELFQKEFQEMWEKATPYFLPNETTMEALEEAQDRERLPHFNTTEDLFKDLGI